MYTYVFGPVPSRRLGVSLGIDVIPKKVCSLDCVYCEVGKTTNLTIERKEYFLYNDIISELDNYFNNCNLDPDYFTFSGSGEPTLNSRIGDIILYVKNRKPSVPIAVLTNGTLLHRKDVRDELLAADIILPSLDAAKKSSFEKINRPCCSINIENYIEGLIELRKEYKGKIYLEVFLLPDYNMEDDDVESMNKAINKIKPDKVQINTLDRPGVINNIRAASYDELKKFINKIKFSEIEIISNVHERTKCISYRKDIENVIFETIARRPCTLNDLIRIVGLHVNEVNKYLDVLESNNVIEIIQQERGFFYQIKNK